MQRRRRHEMDVDPAGPPGVRSDAGAGPSEEALQQLFASFAYLRTSLDERLMLDAVDGVEGTRDMRAALGFNWAQQSGRAARNDGSENGEWNWVILLLPQQAELSWERSCGSERIGVTFAYGI